MYLIHLPIVIWLAGALAPVALPIKFLIVLGTTPTITVATYTASSARRQLGLSSTAGGSIARCRGSRLDEKRSRTSGREVGC